MKKLVIALLFVVTVCLTLSPTGSAETLPLLTLEFPPWNYEENGEIKGSSVEVVKEIFQKIGYDITIGIKPWKRGQKETAEGKYAGAFTLTKSPERLKYYYFSNPVSTITEVFFKKDDSDISWNKLEDLKGMSIGVVDGYNYSDEFKEARKAGYFDIQPIASLKPDYQNMRKLAKGRIDLFVCYVGLGTHVIKTNPGLNGISFINKPIGKPRFFYFVFSKRWPNAKELRDKFNAELRKYALEGKLDAIHKKYGITAFFDESIDGKIQGFQDHYRRVKK